MERMVTSETEIRISYADTDQMGTVYYANYLVFFERGRTEWLRQYASPYRELEQQGLYFPVIECRCAYHAPAHYDDVVTVATRLAKIGFASLEFDYEIRRGDAVIVTGVTRHPLVNRDFKPVRLPRELREKLEKAYAEKDPHRG